MGLLLRATHRMSARRPLTCHHPVDLFLLSMGQTLACTSLQQSGLTPVHHRPTVLDTSSREEAVFLSSMDTVGLLLTVVMLE